MTDLSHWDFAEHFSGHETAALILGLEPRDSESQQGMVNVVLDRMELHYNKAVNRFKLEVIEVNFDDDDEDWNDGKRFRKLSDSNELISFSIDELLSQSTTRKAGDPFSVWLMGRRESRFENQKFERASIAIWLDAIGMQSRYSFRRGAATPVASETESTEIDPSDLPIELDAANLAFRAVMNNYGDQSTTPRNRLVDYIEEHFPEFKPEQVQRIATVANPDKTTGRKRSSKE
jgi:hypothetical protein